MRMQLGRSIRRARPMPPRCAVLSKSSGFSRTSSSYNTSRSASHDGIWITDAMLARASERFHRVSPTRVRSLNSCPGPMESRRRLGKRHMTGIMPVSRASPFPWHIGLPFPIDSWTWKPPTKPEERSHDPTRTESVSLVERFIRWLESAGTEEAPLIDVAATKQRASDHVRPSRYEAMQDRMNEKVLKLLRSNESRGRNPSTQELMATTRRYLTSVLKMIEAREITTADLLRTLDPFDDTVKLRLNCPTRDHVQAYNLECIINAIHKNRITPKHDAYGRDFWEKLSDTITRMTPHSATLIAFQALYQKGKTDTTDFIKKEHLCRILKASIDYGAGRLDSALKFNRRGEMLCRAFEAIIKGPQEIWEMYKEGLRHCARQPQALHQRHFLTFLHFVALQESISTVQFAQLVHHARRFIGDIPVDDALKLAHARYFVKAASLTSDDRSYKIMISNCAWSDLGELAGAAVEGRRMQNFRVLTETCHALGYLRPFLTSVAQTEYGEWYMKYIIRGTDNHHVALSAWHAANPKFPDQMAWEWWLWLRHAEAIIKDETLPSTTILHVAYLLPMETVILDEIPAYEAVHGMKSRRDLIEKIAQWYTEIRHVSDRVAQRRIEVLISFFKAADRPLSEKMVSHLAAVVLRAMEKGELAPPGRLKFLVEMVHNHFGREKAELLLKQIQGWEDTIRVLPDLDGGSTDKQKTAEEEMMEIHIQGQVISENLQRWLIRPQNYRTIFRDDVMHEPIRDDKYWEAAFATPGHNGFLPGEVIMKAEQQSFEDLRKLEERKAQAYFDNMKVRPSGVPTSEDADTERSRGRIAYIPEYSAKPTEDERRDSPTQRQAVRRQRNRIHPSPSII